MGNKKLILGLGVIVLVCAVFIISGKLTDIRPPEHRTRFFPELEERHITAIVINEGDAATTLEKRDGVWMAGNTGGSFPTGNAGEEEPEEPADTGAPGEEFFPAEEALVQIAVERIISLRKTELISENPANRHTFEVEDESNLTVEIYAQNESAPAGVLIIGKGGPDWNSNYIRLKGTDGVYLISGGLRQALFFDFDRWKKRMPDPDPEPEFEMETGIDS